MKKSAFYYDLPADLIADRPLDERRASRLLTLNGTTGGIHHKKFSDILEFLKPNDLLVFNNTKVIPARLFAKKPTGGRVEVMLDQIINEKCAKAQIKASRAPKENEEIIFEDGTVAVVTGRVKEIFEIVLAQNANMSWFLLAEKFGEIPLPPYMNRKSTEFDEKRYQTVYAQEPGSVAAPTAGLHFDDEMMSKLDDMGVRKAFVTLNIGAGTYLPVRTDDIQDHHMHSEFLTVNQDVCDLVAQTKNKGGRVIAVGTTSVRSLESAAQFSPKGVIEPYQGETNIFIYPGYKPLVVDALITNFHLPESTLIMLVSALAGYKQTMSAYRQAVEEGYRFFSYGDSMFITCNPDPDCPI